MKIKLNDFEVYEIKLGDNEINLEEFKSLLTHLNNIASSFNGQVKVPEYKQIVQAKAKPVKEVGNRKKRNHFPRVNWTREKVIEIIKLHYYGTKEQKIAFAKSINREWNYIIKSFFGLRKRFNITAQDVGLQRFPNKGESKGNVDGPKVI